MRDLLGRFLRGQDGATAIEYGLIALLIAVAVIAGVTTVGTSLDGGFNNIAGRLP